MSNLSFNIEKKVIGKHSPTYFIADIAANHDGDIERAKDLIFLASEAGADAAKFQHFQAKTIVSDYGFKSLGSQQSHQANWKKSVYEVYDAASVSLDWTNTLIETCRKAKITFFTTPYSLEIVDLIDKFVPAFKIGSGDITWFEMLKKVASKNKPYFIASGASDINEVLKAMEVCLKINKNVCLMQCNTNYTGDIENFRYINLNVLKSYKELFPELILGLSDHTPGHSTVLGAVTLGARVIEKHFTDDTKRNGPDHAFSMDCNSWNEMVLRTRELELALGSHIKKIEDNEIETSVLQRRSLRANKNLSIGHILTRNDFNALRPCPKDAFVLENFNKTIGKKLNRDISTGDYLRKNDVN